MSIKDELKSELLNSIALKGGLDNTTIRVNPIIATTEQAKAILNLSSGLPRIQSHLVKKFQLVISQPLPLKALSPLAIRCCLCSKAISYPVWYYNVRYAVNEIHYFVCFSSPDKANANCIRRY